MRAVIYCRVSTDDQEKEGTSLKTQKEACLEHCRKNNYDVAKQFSETYSGLTLDRPKLKDLRNLVYSENIDVIVVYCLDRISRDPTHGVILTQEFEKHNVKFEAVTENVDSTELGKLISYIRGFASKLEAEKIKERTIRGKLARIKEGRLPQGTGKGIYGYDWNKTTGHRIINDSESKTVRYIYNSVIKGDSFNKIAVNLNKDTVKTKTGSLWHPLTIRRIAKNITYTGQTYYGQTYRNSRTTVKYKPKDEWILIPNVTPQIISQELFDRTQEAIDYAKAIRPIKPNASYLLTGFARCPKCGSPIGGTMLQGKYRYYQCRGSKPTSTRGKICDAGYIKADQIESKIWEKIVDLVSSDAILYLTSYSKSNKQNEKIRETIEKDIKKLTSKINAYTTKEANLIDLFSEKVFTKDILLDKMSKLKQELKADQNQLVSLKTSRNQIRNSSDHHLDLTELSKQIITTLSNPNESLSLETKRNAIKNLNLKIRLDPNYWSVSLELGTMMISSTSDNKPMEPTKEQWESMGNIAKAQDKITVDENTESSPDYNLIADAVNKAGFNLVTTEQTSASLHARSCPTPPAVSPPD